MLPEKPGKTQRDSPYYSVIDKEEEVGLIEYLYGKGKERGERTVLYLSQQWNFSQATMNTDAFMSR